MTPISKKLKNGLQEIIQFCKTLSYRNIIIALLVIVVIVLCVRSYYYNDKEGFESEIKALIDYEYKK